MALAAVVAGPYTGAYNGSGVGQQQDGFTLRQQVSKQIITSNTYGDSAIDGVYRGGNVFLIYTGIEYSLALACFWPYGAFGAMGLVGRLDVGGNIAPAAVLTAIAGTSAQNAPSTLTAGQAIIDESFNGELKFASAGRFVPITLRCYPYASGGNTVWFTTT